MERYFLQGSHLPAPLNLVSEPLSETPQGSVQEISTLTPITPITLLVILEAMNI